MSKMDVESIKELRAQLPDNWQWEKCYEFSYINSYTGNEFIKKHWAIKSTDPKERGVASLALISHDCDSTRHQLIKNDYPAQFVEQSLHIVDFLLSEIERLKTITQPNK